MDQIKNIVDSISQNRRIPGTGKLEEILHPHIYKGKYSRLMVGGHTQSITIGKPQWQALMSSAIRK